MPRRKTDGAAEIEEGAFRFFEPVVSEDISQEDVAGTMESILPGDAAAPQAAPSPGVESGFADGDGFEDLKPDEQMENAGAPTDVFTEDEKNPTGSGDFNYLTPDGLQREVPETSGSNDEPLPEDTLPANAAPVVVSRRRDSFYDIDFKRLYKNLSEAERAELNALTASYRSQSILTGTVIGVDKYTRMVVNERTGKDEMKTLYNLVIISHRIKVNIPQSEVWAKGEDYPDYMVRGMMGAKIDYVVTKVDTEGKWCLASRTRALEKRRRAFRYIMMNSPRAPKAGDLIKCSVTVVGGKRCLVTCGGYDVPLWTTEMSYTQIADMREVYRPAQELSAMFLEYDAGADRLSLSVKLAAPHPFIGAEERHPAGQRRQAVISGKYAGGVFCNLPDGTMIHCVYSDILADNDFLVDDNVIVHVTHFDYNKQFVFGRIVTKW